MKKTTLSQMKTKGFTIVELLIAMTLTVFILLVLFSFLFLATEQLQNGRNKVETSLTAKRFFNWVEQDFKNSIETDKQWLSIKQSPITDGMNSFPNRLQVTVLTLTPELPGEKGDVIMVNYECHLQDILKKISDSFDSATLKEGNISCDIYRHMVLPNELFISEPSFIQPAIQLASNETPSLSNIYPSDNSSGFINYNASNDLDKRCSVNTLLAQKVLPFTVTAAIEVTLSDDTKKIIQLTIRPAEDASDYSSTSNNQFQNITQFNAHFLMMQGSEVITNCQFPTDSKLKLKGLTIGLLALTLEGREKIKGLLTGAADTVLTQEQVDDIVRNHTMSFTKYIYVGGLR